MGNYRKKVIANENGVTLIELLVSIVLLAIIFSIMINVFVQSSSVNKTSEEIVDATYVAQTYMEKIYHSSVQEKYSNRLEGLTSILGITGDNIIENGDIITISFKDDEHNIVIELHENLNLFKDGVVIGKIDNTSRVIIEVYNQDGKLEATLDNVIEWKEDSE